VEILLISVVINYVFLLTISGMAIFGMAISTQLSKKIDHQKLKPVFGYFLLLVGIYVITKEFFIR
jgi:uncharacterized protein